MTQQKSLIDWLKDAHAMEAGGVMTLSDHAAAARNYPEVQAKLEAHAQVTRRHAERLEERLERLGESPSSLKEAVGAAFSKVAGVANLPASDTVVKNALGDFAAENFEIASYRSLIAAAEAVGDYDTASVCEQILREEEAMADWLREQIPVITRRFLTGQAGTEDGGLPDEVEAAAPDAGGTRNALLGAGALLAGAGAALLVGKALQGGSDSAKSVAADAQAYAGVTGGRSTAQGTESEPVLEAEGVVSDMSLESVRSVAPAEVLADPGGADEAGVPPSQDELIAETAGGDAGFLVAPEPQSGETTGVPELHDGSQDEAGTPEDAERR